MAVENLYGNIFQNNVSFDVNLSSFVSNLGSTYILVFVYNTFSNYGLYEYFVKKGDIIDVIICLTYLWQFPIDQGKRKCYVV